MGETLGREIAAHFSLAAAPPMCRGRRNRARRPRKAFSRPPTHSAVLSADTFLWRRSSLSFHGDLIRPLLLVTRTRRQAEQSEQTEMDLIIRGRSPE